MLGNQTTLIFGGTSDDKRNEIQGCITVPEDVSMDEVIDKFIAVVEENNWSFVGGYKTIIDGYYMNDDGTRGKYVLDE